MTPVPDLTDVPQVQFTAPPQSIMDAATRMVMDSFAQMPPNANTAIFPIFHYKNGKLKGNAAIVHRFTDHMGVVLWIGKEWGEPVEVGGGAVIAWK
jgi:hypothetical protein